jgi:hypothetical protein
VRVGEFGWAFALEIDTFTPPPRRAPGPRNPRGA